MLTVHVGDEGTAVAVDGARIAALGPEDEVLTAYPDARVRRWPGRLGPGLLHEGALPLAPTPRERVHAALTRGATAVQPQALSGDEPLRAAAHRAGLALTGRAPDLAVGARADLAVLAADGTCVATLLGGRLVHRRA
jgi:predicted amidohydrolase YtcJ